MTLDLEYNVCAALRALRACRTWMLIFSSLDRAPPFGARRLDSSLLTHFIVKTRLDRQLSDENCTSSALVSPLLLGGAACCEPPAVLMTNCRRYRIDRAWRAAPLAASTRFTLTFGVSTVFVLTRTVRNRKWTDCTEHRPWCLFFLLQYSALEWRNSLRRLCKLIRCLPSGKICKLNLARVSGSLRVTRRLAGVNSGGCGPGQAAMWFLQIKLV